MCVRVCVMMGKNPKGKRKFHPVWTISFRVCSAKSSDFSWALGAPARKEEEDFHNADNVREKPICSLPVVG